MATMLPRLCSLTDWIRQQRCEASAVMNRQIIGKYFICCKYSLNVDRTLGEFS
ncbi:hypothetical protein HMPREF3034_01813 [Prevotella sp. DNF00663]|nr:hypothetical protein HMPREF3034_01813 [Prevotella sp. DNF00663]